jgi:hypothetical protein
MGLPSTANPFDRNSSQQPMPESLSRTKALVNEACASPHGPSNAATRTRTRTQYAKHTVPIVLAHFSTLCCLVSSLAHTCTHNARAHSRDAVMHGPSCRTHMLFFFLEAGGEPSAQSGRACTGLRSQTVTPSLPVPLPPSAPLTVLTVPTCLPTFFQPPYQPPVPTTPVREPA